jgi:hypothetical protein
MTDCRRPGQVRWGNNNRLRVFGRNSAANANQVNDQSVTAKGDGVTNP